VDDSWLEYRVQTSDYLLYANKKYTVGMKVSVTGFEGAAVTPETWQIEVSHTFDSIYFVPMS